MLNRANALFAPFMPNAGRKKQFHSTPPVIVCSQSSSAEKIPRRGKKQFKLRFRFVRECCLEFREIRFLAHAIQALSLHALHRWRG